MPKKKKQSRFKKFISWFKPTSPAKGALLFAIAFALIGGGYMAYKSFAIIPWYHYPKDFKLNFGLWKNGSIVNGEYQGTADTHSCDYYGKSCTHPKVTKLFEASQIQTTLYTES